MIVCSCIGDTLFSDGTNAYFTRLENDHYGYHNAATTRQRNIIFIIMLRRWGRKKIIMFILMLRRRSLFLNRCPTSTTTRACLPFKKGAQEVCEPTVGSIHAHVNQQWGHLLSISLNTQTTCYSISGKGKTFLYSWRRHLTRNHDTCIS